MIDELGGDYVTAEDIGTTTADMDLMSQHTPYVVGRSVERGGGGDPSPVTAETVFRAILCGLRATQGSDDLDGRRVGDGRPGPVFRRMHQLYQEFKQKVMRTGKREAVSA